MAVASDYVSGTITVTKGSAAFTGTGTLWRTAGFREGDTVQLQGLTAVIVGKTAMDPLIDTNTSGRFSEPWAGTTGTFAYRMRQLPDGARQFGQSSNLIELLGDGTLSSIAGLGAKNGKLLVGNAAGQYELIDKTALAIADPNGSLGKLAGLTLAARQILQTDANGALKAIALGVGKLLRTDANKDIAQSDITAAALSLLALPGAGNKLAYFNGADTAALTDLTAAARALLNLVGTAAANKFAYFDSANSAALADITAAARSLLGNANMPGTLSGFRNKIINGDFSINQRNGSRTPGVNVYGFDMWKGHANGLQQICEALPAGQYTLTWNGGGNGTFAGTTKASPIVGTVVAGNTVVVIPSAATGVSLVPGDATGEVNPFSPRHPQQELALCQRYFETGAAIAYDPYVRPANALVREFLIPFVVQKRVAPTMAFSFSYTNGSKFRDDLLMSNARAAYGYLNTGTATNVDISMSWTADASL